MPSPARGYAGYPNFRERVLMGVVLVFREACQTPYGVLRIPTFNELRGRAT